MASKLGHYPPPPLPVWASLLRYAVAVPPLLLPPLLWLSSANPEIIAPGSPIHLTTGAFLVDLVVSVLCLVLLHFRRRWPLPVSVLITLAGLVSIGSMGAAAVALASVCTRRRWPEIGIATGTSLVVAVISLFRGDVNVWSFLGQLLTQGLTLAVLVFIGLYVGARRDLLSSLRERAETAEREQVLRVQQARVGERARIAREMHDVMAHRVSLVALHADALAFREDLSADQMRDAAKVIQQNAHQALTELRGVLGALRQDEDAAAPPQPTLAALDALLADARESGQRIDADVQVDPADVPERISRDAFRVLQEGLTNARKHAPGTKVTVQVTRDDTPAGAGLRILVTNPNAVGGGRVPGSKVGLVGLRERVEMADGSISAGPRGDGFALDVWLPLRERPAGALS